jgi:hypothetical protein
MPGEQTTGGARRLADVLLAPHDDVACERCLDSLEEYCAAQLRGEDATRLMPVIASHLDSCVACSEAYALVYESLLGEASIPEPSLIPRPDLSFLPARQSPQGSFQDVLSAALEQTGSRLRLTFSQLLLDLLPPMPALALRTADTATPFMELSFTAVVAPIESLQIVAIPAAGEEHCDLLIRIGLVDRVWPDLDGIAIVLHHSGQTLRATTDAWGEVRFSSIERAMLASMRIEVVVAGGLDDGPWTMAGW